MITYFMTNEFSLTVSDEPPDAMDAELFGQTAFFPTHTSGGGRHQMARIGMIIA